jgi:hypothetical protein
MGILITRPFLYRPYADGDREAGIIPAARVVAPGTRLRVEDGPVAELDGAPVDWFGAVDEDGAGVAFAVPAGGWEWDHLSRTGGTT